MKNCCIKSMGFIEVQSNAIKQISSVINTKEVAMYIEDRISQNHFCSVSSLSGANL